MTLLPAAITLPVSAMEAGDADHDEGLVDRGPESPEDVVEAQFKEDHRPAPFSSDVGVRLASAPSWRRYPTTASGSVPSGTRSLR